MTRPGRYPAEIRERAVRMVFEHERDYFREVRCFFNWCVAAGFLDLCSAINGSAPSLT